MPAYGLRTFSFDAYVDITVIADHASCADAVMLP
jgi:hypothetical protein